MAEAGKYLKLAGEPKLDPKESAGGMSTSVTRERASSRHSGMFNILDELDAAITKFTLATEDFRTTRTLANAEIACWACRSAVELFKFCWADYGVRATIRISELLGCLGVTEALLRILGSAPDGDSICLKYAENVAVRKDLVEALIAGDRERVKSIVGETLPTADGELTASAG